MDKKKSISVVCVYDGDQDAAEVFADLIFRKIKERETLANDNEIMYNKDVIDTQNTLGLCG